MPRAPSLAGSSLIDGLDGATLGGINGLEGRAMARVSGIGGFFFRAKSPANLAASYETHFEINQVPQAYDQPVWRQEACITIFAPFEDDTTYFGRPLQSWMPNFWVDDLTSAVQDLRDKGVEVEEYPNGFFARLANLEGNPIQLWQANEPGA
jgi:glyoxylase I family protein